MTKVKTFHAGMAEGWCEALKCLDRQIEEKLAGVVIHSVTDTYHEGYGFGRIVIYSEPKPETT